MGLKKMKSKFFGSSSSSSTVSSKSSTSQRSSGPPPMPAMPTMPAISGLHIPPPAQRTAQKVQKQPIQVTYVTNENIRELRELIRYRYALDCKIWSVGRKVKWYQRDTVEADMRRSDAALTTIRITLGGWDRPEFFASMEQYKRFKEIKNRIVEAETRNWDANPPWAKEEAEPRISVHEKDGRPIHYVQQVNVARGYPRY
ncbi:hypothetical protein GQ44DRAFT_704550 [Phaeosphaeriaceae sp. PMI808]|nr:hypothetical protein GQ44DRAFT_704550 [Phaeosphaeriaceae sp. PMI808]